MKSMQRTIMGVMMALMAMSGVVLAGGKQGGHEGHDMGHGGKQGSLKTTKNATVKGEVVDLTCYLSHSGMGEKHKTCGIECAEKGLPIGLLDAEKKTYLVVTNRHEPANKELAKYMAQQVTIKGDVIEGNGVTLLVMSKVTK